MYEWDGRDRAVSYARALWRVLMLVSVPGSIHFRVLPGVHRDELLVQPHRHDPEQARGVEWSELVGMA